MPDTKTRVTVEGLKPTDFKLAPNGSLTIDSDALGKALKEKFPGSKPGSVFPGGSAGPNAEFVRVSVDVG